MSFGSAHKRNQFSKNEDKNLKELVSVFGENNWSVVAKHMDQRNPRQCRDRYKNYLSPRINCSPWTFDEELKLDMLVNYFGKKWSIISKFFPGRTEINVKCHYSMIERRKKKATVESPIEEACQPKQQVEQVQDLFDFNFNLEDYWETFEF